jgi:hypothetical protein
MGTIDTIDSRPRGITLRFLAAPTDVNSVARCAAFAADLGLTRHAALNLLPQDISNH